MKNTLSPYFSRDGAESLYFQKKPKKVCVTGLTESGTGKTFMAFQIIYRLLNAGIKKKILFLADRNNLIDQTISGDFKPFGGKMTKVENKKRIGSDWGTVKMTVDKPQKTCHPELGC